MTQAGATASVTLRVSEVLVVGRRGPVDGGAVVEVDGVAAAPVDLHAAGVAYRRVVFRRSFPFPGEHAILVRGLGTPGHPGLVIDVFVALVQE